MSKAHPIIAAIYDRMCAAQERAFLANLRDQIVGRAHGTVVEVGAGTGLNFPHYRASDVHKLHAVEPDPYMRRRARPRLAQLGFQADLVEGTAERLPFDNAGADTLVATLVLCSVDEPRRAVEEFRRVLKPGGSLLFIEHVRSDEPRAMRIQQWVTPLWKRLAGNCHVNRATLTVLREAGFAVEEIDRVPRGGPWGNPIVAGVAAR